ncbi:UvrD-helicase domain-containing protein [Peribacillus simplex]|uniref:DNA 3'-5' helicase n=2 Tax=Peribacillus TaxID=2675229 RepID=A0AA90T8I3_9BACI|nr:MULTISPECIES: UvrD-helicase domain-containing protein [Peribacillus]MDP1421160.1 UvrD-helicase domain-containing protein [Peribacillus simplex]MDP1453927.1 UvrD-helicase domain-containing protein [Peribacillus frigoritolerans]
MNLFNIITGRAKLIEEVQELTSTVARYKKETKQLEQQIRSYESNYTDAIKNISNLKDTIASAELEITAQNKEIQEKEKLITTYSKYYGDILDVDRKGNKGLSEHDQDKSFFDFLRPKNDNNDFNDDQVEAIRYNMKKNLRIIAGAGSGKTQTICAKTAYLIMMENVKQDKIAMFTFTNKAASEMRTRVNEFLDEEESKVVVGTFNGIFASLYNDVKRKFPYVERIGIEGEDVNEGQRKYNRLLNGLIRKYGLKPINEGEKPLKEKIGYWTNMGFTSDEMTKFIKKHFDDLEPNSDNPLSLRFSNMMTEFNEQRKTDRIMVFDDQIVNLLKVLQQDDDAREYLQQRFDYIFIDEFQDTNPLQMEIIKLLCPPDKKDAAKLIIVGDDDQSIYYFRGAEPKFIKEFAQTYSTHTLTLMTNYRSIESIVKAGNRVITHNAKDRIKKSMTPFHYKNGDCYIKALSNPAEEANWIINQAVKIGTNEQQEVDYSKSVVLYRSSTQLKTLLQQLEILDIPFVIETNQDLMGIFNIDGFKQAFDNWVKFINEGQSKLVEWNMILKHTANAFYRNNRDITEFQRGKGDIDPSDAAEFICGRSSDKNKKMVIEYLNDLIQLKIGKPVSLKSLIKKFLTFPVIEKQLTKEEKKWIEMESEEFDSWTSMMQRYSQMKKKKDEMKKKIEDYHNGNYNALYLLTIHKSKGLSFENVFLIGLYENGLPSKRAIKKPNKTELKKHVELADPPSTIEEERRLMYVAVTRPKKNLYITLPKTINDKPVNRSVFIKEIQLPVK